jgi:integrase
VPINDTLLAYLHEARNVRLTDYVIEWNGYGVRSIKPAFQKACNRAGLDDVTPHVLRHTAASHMAMAGVSMQQIARMLGHTDSRITERVYAHHSPDYLRGAADKLG